MRDGKANKDHCCWLIRQACSREGAAEIASGRQARATVPAVASPRFAALRCTGSDS